MREELIAFVVLISILSCVGAVLAYIKARRLHFRIEDLHPGFNRFMRKHWRR